MKAPKEMSRNLKLAIAVVVAISFLLLSVIFVFKLRDSIAPMWLVQYGYIFNEPTANKYAIAAVCAMVVLAISGVVFIYIKSPLGPTKKPSSRFFVSIVSVVAVGCYLVMSTGWLSGNARAIASISTATTNAFSARSGDASVATESLVLLEYAKGKRLHVYEVMNGSAGAVEYYLDYFVPDSDYETKPLPVLSKAEEACLVQQEHYIAREIVCVFGQAWKDAKDIYCVAGESGAQYLVPSEEYAQCIAAASQDPVSERKQAYDPLDPATGMQIVPRALLSDEYAGQNCVLYQTLFIISLYILGVLCMNCFGATKSSLLHTFLALPVGCAVMVVLCTFASYLNIRMNALFVVLAFLILSIAAIICMIRNKVPFRQLTSAAIFLPILVVMCIIFVSKGNYYLSYDSTIIIALAKRLVEFGSVTGAVADYVASGNFSIMLLAMGEALTIGVPYAIYPIMFVSILLLTGTYCLKGNAGLPSEKARIAVFLSIVAGMLLLFCEEYDYHKYWILNNMPASLYMLIFTCSLLSIKSAGADGMREQFLCLICGSVIMVTRTEGAIYVAFFLALSFVANTAPSIRTRIMAWLCAICLAYNMLVYLNLIDGINSIIARRLMLTFWSTDKAILSVSALLAVFIMNLLYTRLQRRNPKITKYAGIIFLLAVVSMLACSIVLDPYGIVRRNAVIIFLNLAAPPMLPIVMLIGVLFILNICTIKRPQNIVSVLTVLGYCVLTFCVFAFRTEAGGGVPLRQGYGDSGRRVLFQAIPLFMTLLASNVMNMALQPSEEESDGIVQEALQ